MRDNWIRCPVCYGHDTSGGLEAIRCAECGEVTRWNGEGRWMQRKGDDQDPRWEEIKTTRQETRDEG